MALGLSDIVAAPRDEAMNGGASTRGFWTKRKRSATSLVAVMALLAGIAVAYKLFDKTIPNNVVRDASAFAFDITAKDIAAGETAFRAVTGNNDEVIFRKTLATSACGSTSTDPNCNVDTYPGDERRTDVLIKNTQLPKHDASWEVHVDPASIIVHSYDKVTNSYTVATNGDATRYINFWKLRVQKQTYFNGVVGEYENNPDNNLSYATACAAAGLKELTKQNPCKLGQIKGAGTSANFGAPALTARPSDDRLYRFYMAEEDDGTDQSKFQGWRITFSLVFTARLPVETETGRTSPAPIP